MEQKIEKMFFYFSEIYIWNVSGRFSQSWIKYLPSAVNVLILTYKLSPNTRRNVSQIDLNENNEKTW